MRISCTYTYMPPFKPPQPPHPSRSFHSTELSSCVIEHLPLSVSHLVECVCQCCSLNLSHPLLPPLCSQVCSLLLRLYSYPANKFISTIFFNLETLHTRRAPRICILTSISAAFDPCGPMWLLRKSKWKWKSLSRVQLFVTPGLYSPWNSLGQNTEVGSLFLLQGIFQTQGSNPGLPNCRRILYQLSHRGSPRILEWVAYSFSRGSFPDPVIRLGSPALQVDSLPT